MQHREHSRHHHTGFGGHSFGPDELGSLREFWFHVQGRRGPFGPPGRSPFGGHGAHGPKHPSWGDWFGSPPPRAERGGVRYLVLDALAERPRHGYEVIQVIEERSGGSYRPSPGVIYPTLQMLEELGHARVVEQGVRDHRRRSG
jgi:Transcriptional regulator PadR-like family